MAKCYITDETNQTVAVPAVTSHTPEGAMLLALYDVREPRWTDCESCRLDEVASNIDWQAGF